MNFEPLVGHKGMAKRVLTFGGKKRLCVTTSSTDKHCRTAVRKGCLGRRVTAGGSIESTRSVLVD